MPHPEEMLCTYSGKVIYDSRKSATRAAVRFKSRLQNAAYKRKHVRGEKALEAYLCTHCEGWHLGHRRKDRSRKRKMAPLWSK